MTAWSFARCSLVQVWRNASASRPTHAAETARSTWDRNATIVRAAVANCDDSRCRSSRLAPRVSAIARAPYASVTADVALLGRVVERALTEPVEAVGHRLQVGAMLGPPLRLERRGIRAEPRRAANCTLQLGDDTVQLVGCRLQLTAERLDLFGVHAMGDRAHVAVSFVVVDFSTRSERRKSLKGNGEDCPLTAPPRGGRTAPGQPRPCGRRSRGLVGTPSGSRGDRAP